VGTPEDRQTDTNVDFLPMEHPPQDFFSEARNRPVVGALPLHNDIFFFYFYSVLRVGLYEG
jgi:hypothetical protein